MPTRKLIIKLDPLPKHIDIQLTQFVMIYLLTLSGGFNKLTIDIPIKIIHSHIAWLVTMMQRCLSIRVRASLVLP